MALSMEINYNFILIGRNDLRCRAKRLKVYLYLVDSHFSTIINLKGFFAAANFCEHCLIAYEDKHECAVCCFSCNTKHCILGDTQMSCIKCHVTLRSKEYFNRHLKEQPRKNKDSKSRCTLYWKCSQCKRVI